MDQLGKTVMLAGIGLFGLGGLLWLTSRFLPGLRLGRLPGDVAVERDGVSFFFPITTMILASIVLTLVFWLVSAVRR